MLLKTYRAPDLATALQRARAEMGPDALVLTTTETPGRLGLKAVEVTVGVAREEPRTEAAPDDSLPRLAEEIRDLRRTLDRGSAEKKPPVPAKRTVITDPIGARPWQPPTPLRATVRALISSGLSEDLARRFTRAAAGGLPATPDAGDVATATARGIGELMRFAALPAPEGRCTFVVGPPGCGKTTTVAKLIARAVAYAERPVFFVQTDRDRVGAFEQAEILSRCIGARVARVEGTEDFDYVLRDAGEGGTIVVDTPGVGKLQESRIDELVELRRRVTDPAVVLLVPAGLHHSEAARIVERFAPLEPTCIGFSRVDDAAKPGQLVTALAKHELPLAFLTNGPSIPGDLEAASAHALAALMLRAGSAPDAGAESAP